MRSIKDVFPESKFKVEKVERDMGSSSDRVIFRLNRSRYCMDFFYFSQVMNYFGVDAMGSIMQSRVPLVRVDSRPLWKKDMNMRMGMPVDFKTPSHYREIDGRYLQQELLKIIRG